MENSERYQPTLYIDRNTNKEYELTWILDPDVDKYQPCTQAYGICFTRDERILAIDNEGLMSIPGGTPEAGETPVQTLKRELMEEANVKVSHILPLGVQKVIEQNNPDAKPYYQYRFVCLVEEVLRQTIDPDPDKKVIHPRFFYPSSEITEHVKWGDAGNAMFVAAVNLFRKSIKE